MIRWPCTSTSPPACVRTAAGVDQAVHRGHAQGAAVDDHFARYAFERAGAHDAVHVQHGVGKTGTRHGAQFGALRRVDGAELIQPRFQAVVVSDVEEHEAVAFDVDRDVAGGRQAHAAGVDAAVDGELRCDQGDGVCRADAAFGAQFTGAFGRGAEAQPAALQVGIAEAERGGDEAADVDLRAPSRSRRRAGC